VLKNKLLIIVFVFLNNYCAQDSEPLNIDLVLKHIKEINVISENIIHGFHYYRTENVEVYQKDPKIKICKINNNLWVVTKGNPWQFHSGYVLCIANKIHALTTKDFFPCAWTEHTLITKISKIISEVKNGKYIKKIKDRNAWKIYTTFQKQIIKLVIISDYSKKPLVTSMYPNSKKDDIDINSSIIFEIMEQQKAEKGIE